MDQDTELKGWLGSSEDPTKVANKIKGTILMFSSIIILIASQLLHIQLSANDMLTFATELGTVGGATWMIYGAGLHLVRWWGTVKKPVAIVPTPPELSQQPIDPGAASFTR